MQRNNPWFAITVLGSKHHSASLIGAVWSWPWSVASVSTFLSLRQVLIKPVPYVVIRLSEVPCSVSSTMTGLVIDDEQCRLISSSPLNARRADGTLI